MNTEPITDIASRTRNERKQIIRETANRFPGWSLDITEYGGSFRVGLDFEVERGSCNDRQGISFCGNDWEIDEVSGDSEQFLREGEALCKSLALPW